MVDGELISSSESRGEMEDVRRQTDTAITVNKCDKLWLHFPHVICNFLVMCRKITFPKFEETLQREITEVMASELQEPS